MQHITASRAKQNFGELLDALAQGPVAIERHKKVKAIVCSPEAFQAQPAEAQALSERRAARAAQLLVDKNRQITHQKLAIDLLLLTEAEQAALVNGARAEVARWRADRLCSTDYADRWDALLRLPVRELARAMGSDDLAEGRALRQNSPWMVARA
ncbi:MAG: hypothetical protein RJA98_2068 [Pseudomonadota bacterium]|jgi:PHD/YefM family antitoxin component YafN of YafNO toxin-antitoxin module